jgi:FkbM family methyltransferase
LPLPAARFAFRVYNKALRMTGPTHIATTKFGAKLLCATTDYVQCIILDFGVWEPNISSVIKQILESGDVFVDIGAHIGYDSLLGSKIVGSNGKVVAIEASLGTFDLLRNNLALNAFATNVRAVNVAVSHHAGKVDLFETDSTNIGAASIDADTVAIRGGKLLGQVDVLPLKDILTDDERRRVRLIKIDVEGGEPSIIHDIVDHLSDYPLSMEIISETSSRNGWPALFERLRANKFSAWIIENRYELEFYMRWKKPAPLRRIESMAPQQQDILFTRRDLDVQSRQPAPPPAA